MFDRFFYQKLISGNKLDCSCALKEFQVWIKSNSIQLNNQSRASAKCGTPSWQSNAALTDLPLLECTDDNKGPNDSSFLPFEQEMNQDNDNNPSIIDPNELSFTNWSFDETYRLVHISWLPKMNMSYFGCDQVQVQCVPTVKGDDQPGRNSPKEVYSKPLECNNLKPNTLINVVREIIYQFSL